jgi:uncharacterized ferredoxin-like protein
MTSFSKHALLTEGADNIVKDLVSSEEYKAILKKIEDLIDTKATDSEDYILLKKLIIPKLIAKFKEDVRI